MYKEALRPAWVEVNLSNLDYNIKSIQKKIGPNAKMVGVIKADAYGHGSVETAHVLLDNGVDTFAIATLAEAATLRNAGIEGEIICLGLTPDMYADAVVEYDVTPVFCSLENARAFDAAAKAKGKTVEALITLDTGMGRIGYQWNDTERAAAELKEVEKLTNFKIKGLLSHFSTADAADLDYAHGQEEHYNHFYDEVTKAGVKIPKRTLANSAAIMRMPEVYFDKCRAGIILYGLYPSHDVDPKDLDIKPVMSVKANIVHLKDVPADFSVGYGRKYISKAPAKIATVGIGYADGYPRPYSPVGKVIIDGHVCPIAGNICMDQFMVDVTDVPDVKVGDEVIVMGSDGKNSITADDIADATGTINYEIVCAFGQRLPKVYVK